MVIDANTIGAFINIIILVSIDFICCIYIVLLIFLFIYFFLDCRHDLEKQDFFHGSVFHENEKHTMSDLLVYSNVLFVYQFLN